MDEKTEWFPWQVAELEGRDFPPNTWFMAEAELDDDPDKMKTIFGAKVDRAIEEQEKMGKVQFRVFNCLFSEGKFMEGEPYDTRAMEISGFFYDDYLYFHPVTWEALSYKDALLVLKDNPDWEGLVIWDRWCTKIPIKWGGSASRKGGAWKLKDFKEADVLIINWETGKGKLNDDVATLTYGVFDDDGNIVAIGRGGSGLDSTLRQEIKSATLPIVAEVKYEELTKGRKMRLPVILRTRIDKPANECLLSEMLS
jgi:ATP-dependent DNA ligase